MPLSGGSVPVFVHS
uniref:Uncharacterized protein n=1 Tax=Anguilla anguilla TaxID=7936 RepID=A0A0E9RPF7_ANGAN